MNFFRLTYLFIATILFIVAFPFLLLFSLKKKYRVSIPRRFFLYKNPPFKKEDAICFHVCSYGEAVSLKPILSDLSGNSINISVITQTGFEAASKYSADVRYLPYELWLPFWIKRQKLLVVSEAELWYMLFFTAKRKGAKTMLINARISDRSYNRYKRFRFFYKKIFENIDQVFAQTTLDKKRLEELGAKNIVVCGNIKAYGEITLSKRYEKPQAEVITIASSHEGEEKILLDSFELKEGMKLIVVPRHPERFDEVAKLLREFANQKHLSFSRFSKSGNFKSDITIVDMMGELVNVYAISDIVLLGGSFVNGIGGHNPLEAAYFETKIISGKYYFNQKALYEMVENIEVIDIEDLPHAFMRVKKSRANFDVEIKPIIEAIKSVV